MSISPSTRYPAQTDADVNYPQGKARNATTQGDGTGTPLEKDWLNDLWGFLQSLLAYAAITPSGVPDAVGASDYLNAVKFAATAAGNKAGERVMLATWSDATVTGSSGEFHALGWIAAWGKFIAMTSFAEVFTSPDGQVWTEVGTALIANGNIAGNPGGTAVAAGAGGVIRTSPDGTTWTTRTSGTANQLNSCFWTGSQFIAVGQVGTVVTSPDGTTWTTRTSSTTNELFGVAGNGSIHVAVGVTGKVITSPDGITWTTRTSGTTEDLQAVAWSPTASLFVAVGLNGKIITSPDGITWTTRTSGTAQNLLGVTPTDNYLIAAGQGGALLFSVNGIAWQIITHPSDSGAFIARAGVAWGGVACVAAGGASIAHISHSLARLP